MDFKLILLSGAEHLEEKLKRKGYEIFKSHLNYDDKRFFPNSDLYTRISEIEEFEEDAVCVLQSCSHSSELEEEKFTTQDRFFEVLQVLQILNHPLKVREISHKNYRYKKLERAKEILVLFLHMPCGKQDHAVLSGEVNSAKLALELTLSMCSRVAIIDPHPERDWFSFSKRIDLLSMVPKLLEEIDLRFESPMLLAPDEGAQRKWGLSGFGKRRISSEKAVVLGEAPLAERVVFLDDLILSGGTLKRVRRHALKSGVEFFGAAATHALPLVDSEENLRNLVNEFEENLIVTNTVPSKTFLKDYPKLCLDCTDLISSYLEELSL